MEFIQSKESKKQKDRLFRCREYQNTTPLLYRNIENASFARLGKKIGIRECGFVCVEMKTGKERIVVCQVYVCVCVYMLGP